MLRRNIAFLTAVLVMGQFVSSCSRIKLPQDLGNTQNIQTTQLKAVYPHSSEFKEATHGQSFREQSASCKLCHGQDLAGGNSLISCMQCHVNPEQIAKVYPHSDVFSESGHGAQYLKQPETCKFCHGKDLSGGIAEVACNGCHEQYPHNKAFMNGGHGIQFKKDASSCTLCHGKDLMGGKVQIACSDCHDEFDAHTAEFKSKKHGDSYLRKDPLVCATCHGDDLKGGTVKVACNSCHNNGVHPDPWVLKSNAHNGEFIKDCLYCHSGKHPAVEPGLQACRHCHAADAAGTREPNSLKKRPNKPKQKSSH